jgi:hypothetical protein
MPRGTKRSESERRALLAEQAQSKLTLAQFAQSKGIPLSTLSGWKTALRSRDAPPTPKPKTPPRPAPKRQAVVLPVRVVEASPSPPAPSPPPTPAPVVVELRTGHRLVLHPGFPAAEVAALIRALEPPC